MFFPILPFSFLNYCNRQSDFKLNQKLSHSKTSLQHFSTRGKIKIVRSVEQTNSSQNEQIIQKRTGDNIRSKGKGTTAKVKRKNCKKFSKPSRRHTLKINYDEKSF